MGQFSVEKPVLLGSVLSGNQQAAIFSEITGRPLWNRLREHAESVRAVQNLDIDDFSCRYLRLDDIWIPLGETLLIQHFKPVWNAALDGFGNHDPGSGRYGGQRPLWDVLHPGRSWATRCAQRPETQAELAERVRKFLSENKPDPQIKFTPT